MYPERIRYGFPEKIALIRRIIIKRILEKSAAKFDTISYLSMQQELHKKPLKLSNWLKECLPLCCSFLVEFSIASGFRDVFSDSKT